MREVAKMSHTVTVTRTTTTTTTSAIIINTGYLKTWPGILKFFELLLGIVCVGLVAHYLTNNQRHWPTADILFLIVAAIFMSGTFMILLSCLLSIATASLLPRTIYEVIYHFLGCVFILVVGLIYVITLNQKKNDYYYVYEPLFAAAIIAMINAVLYLLSTVFAWRSYKGM
ncbi:uncharacterized protein LOC143199799 isoform X1 [Rhynchophorus ferrugineus]|uniref:uncharacterized protein LOC143199799 isoform X1 n=2 Tax=Rhynchophorus ferrugineus TaxID=354439 RepID=UPI003FCE800D